MNLATLILFCAPAIHPVTANAVIQHESGGKQYAIGINEKNGQRVRLTSQPQSEEQAVALAKNLIEAGYSIDLGYAQINSKNLPRLGIKVDDIFKPCVNMQAMQEILKENYLSAASKHGQGQKALQVALSKYNTGDEQRGFKNGYVASVYQQVNK